MAEKNIDITIVSEKGTFTTLLSKIAREKTNKSFDFEGLSSLRKLLSNEKAKLLFTLKTQKPKSIYELAKILGRNFKSVNDDVKLLERFGFVKMVSEKTGKRGRLRPVISVEQIKINLKI